MARGKETGRHPNRQVSRGFKPYGYIGNTSTSGSWDMNTQMSDTKQPVNVGYVKTDTPRPTGKYIPAIETVQRTENSEKYADTMHTLEEPTTFRTKRGARQHAKKMVKWGRNPLEGTTTYGEETPK
jgi:hypothetical protein